MTEKIEVVRTINDDDLIRSFMRQQSEIVKETQKLGKLAMEGRKVEKTFDKTAVAAKKAFEDTRTPLERYTRRVGELKKMLRDTDMTQDTYNRSIRKARQEYVKAGRAAQGYGNSARAANRKAMQESDRAASSIGRMVQTFAGIGAVTKGIQVIVAQVRRELEMLKQVQKEAQEKHLEFGPAVAQAFRNSGGAFTPEEFNKRVLDLTSQLKSADPTAVANTLGSAISSIGPTNKKELELAFSATRAAHDFAPLQSGETAKQLAGVGGKIAKVLNTTPERGIGLIQSTGNLANITELEPLVKNIGPTLLNLTQFGFSAKESSGFLSALTQGIGDQTGEISATAAVNFAKSLREFREKTNRGAESPIDTVRAMRKDPAMRQLFLRGGKIGKGKKAVTIDPAVLGKGKALPTIESFLGEGDGKIAKQFEASLPQIGGLDKAGEVFQQNRDQIRALPSVRQALIQRTGKSTLDVAKLKGTKRAESATIREMLEGVRKELGKGALQQKIDSTITELKSAGELDFGVLSKELAFHAERPARTREMVPNFNKMPKHMQRTLTKASGTEDTARMMLELMHNLGQFSDAMAEQARHTPSPMPLSHGGYNFLGNTTHGDVVPAGPFELSDVRTKFFGVIGESEIRGEPGGRDLTCRMTLRGYASETALIAAFNEIASKANQLTGTLTVTGNLAKTFGNCTFKGVAKSRTIRNAVDDTYLSEIALTWRQLTKDASASGEANLEESITGSQTDTEYAIAIDVSALKALFIQCDTAVTIETNSGSAADDTLTIAANRPLIWYSDGPIANPLSTDLTPSTWPQPLQMLAVSAANRTTDYGDTLPLRPYNVVRFKFTASSWPSDSKLIELRAGTTPGGAVVDSNVVGKVLYDTDRDYTIDTPPLAGSGTWNFEVVGIDDRPAAGNEGTALAGSKTILAHPPDVQLSSGSRLSVSAAIGSVTWSPSGGVAHSSDDTYSIAALGASAVSYYYKLTNFGLAIPTGATINGITVEWEVSIDLMSGLGTVDDNAIRIVKGGTIGSTDKSSAINWTDVDDWRSYGGSADLWGETWSASDINSSNFGAAMSCKENSGADGVDARLDTCRITVDYTAAAGKADVQSRILRRRKRTEHRQPPRFEFEQRAAAKRRARIVPQTDASTTPLLGEVVRRRRRTEHRQPPRFEFEQQAAAKRRAFVPKLVYTPSGQVLDFNDNTFKAIASATTPYLTATERTGMGGTRTSYQADLDLSEVNNTPTLAEYVVMAFDNASPADTDNPVGNPLAIQVRFAEEINGNSFVEVHTEVSVKSTSGTTAQVTAWLEHNGQKIDLDAFGGVAFTADAGTDVCTTSSAHGLSDTDAVLLTTSDTLPAGLSVDTVYFIRDKTSTTFKLAATSGGSAIDITDAGTGTHKFHISTASVTLREHGSGSNLFSKAMTLDDVNSNVFEAEQSSPGFTDDRQYDVIGSITIEGVTFTSEDNRVAADLSALSFQLSALSSIMTQRVRNPVHLVTDAPFGTEGLSLYATIGDEVQYRNLRLLGHRRRRRGRRRRRNGWIKGAGGNHDIANAVTKTARRTFTASPTSSISGWAIPASFASQTVTIDVRRCKDDVEHLNNNSKVVTVTFDASRDIVTEIRGTATLLDQEIRADGYVRLRLIYHPAATGVQPTLFRATRTAGPTSPADATTTYSGQKIITITTPQLSDASDYTYKITAENGATTLDAPQPSTLSPQLSTMTTPPPTDKTELSQPGATYTVCASAAGASSVAASDLVGHLRVLRISRRSAGRDTCTFAYDLGETGERLEDLQTPTGFNRIVEVRLDDPDTLDWNEGEPLFWGDLVVQTIELSSDREQATVTARMDPYLFGEILDGYTAFDVSGAADVRINDDPVFNPKIDARTASNMSQLRANTGNHRMWLDPESVRTKIAETYQQHDVGGVQAWTVARAIESLCGECNAAESTIKNPKIDPDDAIFEDCPAPDNVQLRRGDYLPTYLDALLPAHGLDWYVELNTAHEDPDDDTTDLICEPAIVIYARGKGVEKDVHWQEVGAELDLSKQNLRAVSLETDIGALANKVTCCGSRKQHEVTIELYRGWPEADDALEVDDLRRDTTLFPDSQYNAKPNAWRLWIANEGGDYCGTRTNVRPIPSTPPDLSVVGAFKLERRLQIDDCLTRDDFLSLDDLLNGRRRPPEVDYYDPVQEEWLPIPRDWQGGGYRILNDQIGVIFTGDSPPAELMDLGDDARLRITGTITAEDRLTASSSSVNTSPNARTVELFVDVSDRFHYRFVTYSGEGDGQDAQGVQTAFTSKYYALNNLWGTDYKDDSTAIAAYSLEVLENQDMATMHASLPLHGIVTSYKIGDIIRKIAGREISLNRKSHASAVKRYLQVTGIDWDFESQATDLIVVPFDPPAWWTIDKVKAALRIVVAHDDFSTGAGTGGVTMVNDAGDAVWTYRMPIDAGTGRRKRATAVKIDPSGFVYVAWDTTPNGVGMGGDTELAGPAGGLLKLTVNGGLVWDISFPDKASGFDQGGGRRFSCQLAIDPTDAAKIWVGTACDEDDHWLHLVDDDGNITASYGNAEMDDQVVSTSQDWTNFAGSVPVLECDGSGRVWFSAMCQTPQIETYLSAMDADGNLLWHDKDDFVGTFPGETRGFDFDLQGRPVVSIDNPPLTHEFVATAIDAFNDDDEHWREVVSDFTPAGADSGSWASVYDAEFSAIALCENFFLAASVEDPTWTDTNESAGNYRLFAVSAGGTQQWTAKVDVAGVKRLAHNSDTQAFTILLGSTRWGSVPFIARINTTNGAAVWTSRFGTDGTLSVANRIFAHDVDVRFA
eukprot:g26687.t1